jgi:hypothetical protein
MIRLKPILTEQFADVVPRDYENLTDITLTLTNEDTNSELIFENVLAVLNGNFITIPITLPLEQEDLMYSLKITKGGSLWFRDKVYVTSTENTSKYHKSNSLNYKSKEDSNKYITL